MTAPLLAALLALAGPASAGSPRVPALPGKFTSGNFARSWRAWGGPMSGALSRARAQELGLSPALQRFAPLTGASSRGAAAAVAPRAASLQLLTAQLEESGLEPRQFEALEPAEQVRRMQEAYEALSSELGERAAELAEAAGRAEEEADAAALHEAESRMSLLLAAHADYMGGETARALGEARAKAFAAKSRLQDGAVERAAREAGGALGGRKFSGFKALGSAPDPWRGAPGGEHAVTRAALLAPVESGLVPPGFGESLSRYHRESGDGQVWGAAVKPLESYLRGARGLVLQADLKALAGDEADAEPAADAPGEGPAEALEALGAIAREAPVGRARDLAAQALMAASFASPFSPEEGKPTRGQALESLRLDLLREAGAAAAGRRDKEITARVLQALEAAAGPKREGEAGEALAAVEKEWKRAFGVPPPEKAKAMRAKGDKQLRSSLFSLAMGAAAFLYMDPGFGAPSWLAWLGSWTGYLGYAPYLGVIMPTLMLLYALSLKIRAGKP